MNSRKQREKRFAQSRLPVMEGKDLVQLYKADLANLPRDLLTREGERKLARRIKKGDPSAYLEFFLKNTRLVMAVASGYINRGLVVGLEYMDLVQEGNIGLLKAIERFDPKLGFKFSTYAFWWITQGITRAIENAGTIRLPAYMRARVWKVLSAVNKIKASTGQNPNSLEISEIVDLTLEEVEKAFKALETTSLTSLDAPLSADGDEEHTFSDVTPDRTAQGDLDSLDTFDFRVRWVINTVLDSRSVEIIALRFGFREHPHTLEEVGEKLGLTRERVRQMEKKALFKLWGLPYLRRLFKEMTGANPVTVFNPNMRYVDLRGEEYLGEDAEEEGPELLGESPDISKKKFRTELEELGALWERQGKEIERLAEEQA